MMARSPSLTLNTARRIPLPTRMRPVTTNTRDTLSRPSLRRRNGARIQTRLKIAAALNPRRGRPRAGAGEGDRCPRQGGPRDEREGDARGIEVEDDGDVPVGDEALEEVHHDVPEAEAREGPEGRRGRRVHGPLEGECDEEVPPEEADGAGDPHLGLPLLREHEEDVHDEENPREDREGSHDEEQLRRVLPVLNGPSDLLP